MSGESASGVGWRAPLDRQTFLRWRIRVFVLALGALAVAVVAADRGVFEWDGRPLDWLFAASLLVLVAYVLVPLAVNRKLTARYWAALRANRLALASLVWVSGVVVVGTVGPLVFSVPTENLLASRQPPMFTTVHEVISGSCLGTVVDGRCQGTMTHPLGTDTRGRDVLMMLVYGSRVAVQVALTAAMLMVPIGIAAGVLAGYRGGLVDDLVMRYVDIQGAVPAFVVYVVLVTVYGRSLLLLVVVFGLLNWGGVARIVRGEVRQRREAGYVQAATVSGASRFYVVRRVLVPNLSNTIVTAVTREAGTLILIEAALAFMKLSELGTGSWGESIAFGMDQFFPDAWWSSTFAVLALAMTVVAFSILGDALRDVLDPDSTTAG